ncbi:MAG: phospholipase D-like domain-containing protein, partial [Isosphaeraceae bacterium]
MNESVDQWLARSLDDHRLSRAERKTVAALLEDRTEGIEPADLRTKAIALARAAVAEQAGPGLAGVLDWLADVIRATEHDGTADQDRRGDLAEVHFSPGDDCVDRIKSLLRGARRTVNICVFTITDDRISDAILDARDRGVSVRIVTDDDKSSDYGSDVERLRNAGIPVRIDRSEYHMH